MDLLAKVSFQAKVTLKAKAIFKAKVSEKLVFRARVLLVAAVTRPLKLRFKELVAPVGAYLVDPALAGRC